MRCFTRSFGIAPHRYLLGRRIEAARRRLLDGEPIADVAAAVGFHDQAHLTRHFKRHVGTTPSRYTSAKVRTRALTAATRRRAYPSGRVSTISQRPPVGWLTTNVSANGFDVRPVSFPAPS